MSVIGSIHDGDKGREVIALETRHRCYGPDFPGWGNPGSSAHLREIAPGTAGTVTHVESHGAAPYTRYAVLFDDGTRASGLAAGQDFKFAG
jgi:hypothetical protein